MERVPAKKNQPLHTQERRREQGLRISLHRLSAKDLTYGSIVERALTPCFSDADRPEYTPIMGGAVVIPTASPVALQYGGVSSWR
jgi:hypothetical protein